MILRFNAPIVFFNAPYFKRQVLAAVDAAGPSLKYLVLDLLPVTMIDTTGLYTAREVADALRERGVLFAAAGRQTEWRLWAEGRGHAPQGPRIKIYPTLRRAVAAFTDIGATVANEGATAE
jgi:MFS superfamily sulfate permease-like transporter